MFICGNILAKIEIKDKVQHCQLPFGTTASFLAQFVECKINHCYISKQKSDVLY